ncbi:putative membrane protein [Propionispora sp. 2/2-37]|uniref:MDR family MFS transporter n=1 Tax=Propionispora sp. 2/2-37 TaxID=1677858 RepID=UPI0006BB5C55|nr:MDR family MFS transporter [Propionispora sp. 2/2-37]CUH97718.1 putative membrane protein [Propionispora sp. 2/2-37]
MKIQLNPKSAVSIVYVTAMFMAVMDGTIVNVALPAISDEFQIPPSAASSVNVGYLVSIAVFLPMAGWLGDRFGTKRTFLIALGMFTFASALCGFADNLQLLNLFRVFQGAGGGLLTPVGMAMLFRTFSPEERPKVSRSLVFPIAIAPVFGPVVGGFLVEQLSWRWVFYINFPIGILALLFGFMVFLEHKEAAAERLDLPGFLLSVPGLSLLMYALIQGPSQGWRSPVIWGAGVCGFIFICFLVFVELRVKTPMLDLRLLSARLFRTMSIISLFNAAGLTGLLFIFPLLYQSALNASALETGLTTFPEALGMMLASRVMPWSYRRLGARQVIAGGLLGAAILIVALVSIIGPETKPWTFRILFLGIGFFLGHVGVTSQFLTFNDITSASMGRATTLFNVQNRIGSALGVVALAGLLGTFGTNAAGVTGVGQPPLAAYRFALLGSAVFLAAALVFALRIRQLDTAAMAPKQVPAKSSGMESSASEENGQSC